jgi:hypothetical protein
MAKVFIFAPCKKAKCVPQNNDPYLPPMSIIKTVDSGETWDEENVDEALYGSPMGMSIPSNDVAYFLCYARTIKYSKQMIFEAP